MFGKLKKANPDSIIFTMENGEPCFYMYLAFPHKNAEFSEKQLNLIAREKFDIECFEQRQPNKQGMWQLVEGDGTDRAWKLKFFPFKGSEDKQVQRIGWILELMHRDR